MNDILKDIDDLTVVLDAIKVGIKPDSVCDAIEKIIAVKKSQVELFEFDLEKEFNNKMKEVA